MFFLQNVRERQMRPQLLKEKNFYSSKKTDEIVAFQLEQFNEIWSKIQVHVSYYRDLVEQKKAPKQFDNFLQFEELPVITRDLASEYMDEFTNKEKKPDSWGTTGGSTGNPLKFPQWKSESAYCEPSVWYVRDFYNIKRSDKMFRLWGHSHTLGTGLTKYKNKFKFDIGLPLIGYKRFSAYNLSEIKLKEAGEEILKFKHNYIIGYSKAL